MIADSSIHIFGYNTLGELNRDLINGTLTFPAVGLCKEYSESEMIYLVKKGKYDDSESPIIDGSINNILYVNILSELDGHHFDDDTEVFVIDEQSHYSFPAGSWVFGNYREYVAADLGISQEGIMVMLSSNHVRFNYTKKSENATIAEEFLSIADVCTIFSEFENDHLIRETTIKCGSKQCTVLPASYVFNSISDFNSFIEANEESLADMTSGFLYSSLEIKYHVKEGGSVLAYNTYSDYVADELGNSSTGIDVYIINDDIIFTYKRVNGIISEEYNSTDDVATIFSAYDGGHIERDTTIICGDTTVDANVEMIVLENAAAFESYAESHEISYPFELLFYNPLGRKMYVCSPDTAGYILIETLYEITSTTFGYYDSSVENLTFYYADDTSTSISLDTFKIRTGMYVITSDNWPTGAINVRNLVTLGTHLNGYSTIERVVITCYGSMPITDMTDMFTIDSTYKPEPYPRVYIFLDNFDTSHVTIMDMMAYNTEWNFRGVLDFSNIDTSNVTSMRNVIRGNKYYDISISGWNTSHVVDMYGAFASNYLDAIANDIHSLDTSNVTNMEKMFLGAHASTLDLSNFDTSNVTNMRSMLCVVVNSLNLSGWDVSNVTDMSQMFSGAGIDELNLSGWSNPTKLETTAAMFHEFSRHTDSSYGITLTGWNVPNLTVATQMFEECGASTIDLSNWNTPVLRWADDMFSNCTNVTSISLAGWDLSYIAKWDLTGASIWSLFRGCTNLLYIDLSGSSFKNHDLDRDFGTFTGCSSLTRIKVENCDTDTITYIMTQLTFAGYTFTKSGNYLIKAN